jgi:single-stranded DNA-binding protein
MSTATKKVVKKKPTKSVPSTENEIDYSLNDLLLRGRVSAQATSKELPSGDKVVEFRLIVTRAEREGVDTLDIAAWSAKSRKIALTLEGDEWVEISGSIHRRFWQSPTGVASRWQVAADEIVRI